MFNVFLGYTIKKIPRRIGIAFFYLIVMLVGISFTAPFVKHNAFIATVLLAVSKLASSKDIFNCSQCLLSHCLHGDLSVLGVDSVNCHWAD